MAPKRLPSWLKIKASFNERYRETMSLIREFNLHTVCQGAQCPNRGICFADGTATFMILGATCTRHCQFCAIPKGVPAPLDQDEPRRVAEAVFRLQLDYVVITSVTRDDLTDGGAEVFTKTVLAIREKSPKTKVEVLTPDFMGNRESLIKVAEAEPDVFNHNIETVPRLYGTVRPQADFSRTLWVLAEMKKIYPPVKTKSGLMVGLGETKKEVEEVLAELRKAGCDMVTIGQYLSPSKNHLPVVEYITPLSFKEYEEMAYGMGFKGIASGPLIRSSYQAKNIFQSVLIK